MRWAAKPKLYEEGEEQLGRYGGYLRAEQDLAPDTVRNYLSDLRQFAAFCEASWAEGEEAGQAFSPAGVTTPAITLYRGGTPNPATSVPYFVLRGNVCALLAAKDHVNVFLYDPLAPDPAGIIISGHENKTGRTVAIYRGEEIKEMALVAMFRAIIAHNRARGWRKIVRQR